MHLQIYLVLGDLRAESYTLGYLGNLYEQTQQWSEANTLTVRALNLAQQLTNPEDVAYLWQWQLGRIFKAQGKNQDAIAAYRASINSLQAIRLDLLTIIDSNVQLSFRESIEPVYRELVPLLLESADTESSSNSWNKPDVLYEAINVIESIQLIESEDFLKQACLENISSFADKIDSKSAVIYSNLLEDQINIILRLPDQSLHHYTTILSENELETTLNSFRKILVEDSSQREKFDIEVFLSLAQKLYDWLLRGVEPYLGQGEIETITFIIDSSLYNFPIAALHDGQQFLIEKYSISLGLKSPNPKRLQRRELRVLAAGLSDSVSYGSPEQSKVFDELTAILSQVADTTVLLNRDFTSANIQSLLNRTYYPIIHLATYGQLSSKLENTFILTGDSRVPGRFLWYFLKSPNLTRQEPIELLVLSGLKLAEGDGTAALGLAGFALQTGAQNTIATFWQVSDEATLVFMEQFYKELNDITITIGEALRRAQNFLLQSEKFSNPFFWATYTLFASWS